MYSFIYTWIESFCLYFNGPLNKIIVRMIIIKYARTNQFNFKVGRQQTYRLIAYVTRAKRFSMCDIFPLIVFQILKFSKPGKYYLYVLMCIAHVKLINYEKNHIGSNNVSVVYSNNVLLFYIFYLNQFLLLITHAI